MSLEDRIDDIALTLRPRLESIVESFDRLLLAGVLPYKITVELDPVPVGIPCSICGVALSAHVLGGPHPPDAEHPQKSPPPQRIPEGIPENHASRRKFPTETLVERGSR